MTLAERFQKTPLILAAVFAIVWALVRACVQSITQDEGDTYFWFASRSANYIWYPFPNNHVLNTLLIWISTRVFGLSSLTLRAPALLGAILYVCVCYFLCRSVTKRFVLQLSIFICLVYNPFVFDFMVAARGYGLATAFLMASIAVPVWHSVKHGASLRKSCALASLALGLSFAASFSFTFTDLAAFLAILAWAIRHRASESLAGIFAYCVLPGMAVAAALCGYPVAHWPKGEMIYTAHSLGEMARSLVDASLYQPYPGFASSYDALMDLGPLLPPILGILCVCQLAAAAMDGSWRSRDGWVGRFAAALVVIAALSVLMHWIAFRLNKFPLPLTRTGLFLLPLCTLAAGVIAAAPARSRVSRWLRGAIAAMLVCLACYFVFCIRMSYFKEYQYDADTKDVYAVLARLNHAYGVTDTAINGLYVAPLNFYRVISNKETFPEFAYIPSDPMPSGKSIYVLEGGYYREFIEREKLAVVYRGKSTAVVVAVKPGGPIPAATIEP